MVYLVIVVNSIVWIILGYMTGVRYQITPN